jgi:trimethylamine:corrinoid methyltransferase-like protein
LEDLGIIDFEKIHHYSLKILNEIGMIFRSEQLLSCLEKSGATVNWASKLVKFPQSLVEDKIDLQKQQIKNGARQIILSGGVATKPYFGEGAKLGAGALQMYNFTKKITESPGESDVINSIIFGHGCGDIKTIGSPLVCNYFRGKKINPNLLPIIRAYNVAKNTDKLGTNEIDKPWQLKYLMEIGKILKNSEEAYFNNPCLITSKHTISPLQLDKDACDVLVEQSSIKYNSHANNGDFISGNYIRNNVYG